MKGGDDGGWILVDHCEQGAGWRFWRAASAFPMLDGIQTEAEGFGKAGLRHVELVANAFHIDFIRHMHLEAFPLSCEKSLNLVQSSHELFKRGFHDLSPVADLAPLLIQKAFPPEFGDSLGELVNCRRGISIWPPLLCLPFHKGVRSCNCLFVMRLNSIVRDFLNEILQILANGLLDRTVRLLRVLILKMQQYPEFKAGI